jgi:hypothetical protein
VRVIGEAPEWLKGIATETRDPFPGDPEMLFSVGAQEEVDARAIAASQAAAITPDRRLTSEQLWRKLPWTKNQELFQLANSQYGFPKPVEQTDSGNLLSQVIVGYTWSERAVDVWLETMRTTAKEIGLLISRWPLEIFDN